MIALHQGKPVQDDDGKCQHVNRVCLDTRNTELFLKRRKYRCDDCKCHFQTAEIIVDIERWSTQAAVQAVMRQLAPQLPDVARRMTTLRRAWGNLEKALKVNPEP